MRNVVLIILLFVIGSIKVKSQSEIRDNIGNYTFIGYYDNNVVLREDDTWDLYLVIENDDPEEKHHYQLFEKGKNDFIQNERTSIDFINNDFRISQKVIIKSKNPLKLKYELIIQSDKYNLVLPLDWLRSDFVVNNDKNLVITTGKVNYNCDGCDKGDQIAPELMQIDLTKLEPVLENIGIRGKHPVILNNNLYFHQYFEEFSYDEKYNLYRVPLREWEKTELVFRQSFRKCYVFPNEKLLFASIYDPNKNNTRYILYSIDSKSYEFLKELDNLYVPEYPYEKWSQDASAGASLYSFKYNTPVLSRSQYHYVKNLPETYTKKYRELHAYYAGDDGFIYKGYEANDDLPKRVDLKASMLELRKHNFPRLEKPFNATFITDNLMYVASKEELDKLSKDELRLLRNAFFARLGYKFKSEDLQDFFGQFEWYNNSEDRLKLKNEDIIIPDEDKKRVDLILEIENNK